VPLVASYLMRAQARLMGSERRAFWSVAACIIFIAVMCGIYLKPISNEHVLKRAETKNYRARLLPLPPDAVVIAGGQTVAVTYWRGIGSGEWLTIGTGGGWPGDNLIPLIETYLQAGRRVFLDKDTRWWAPCGWQEEETRAIVTLESHFRFRRVMDNIYELRPPADEAAQDAPNLKSLLPENRPDEMKKCAVLEKAS
jgi:hypothetical protein